MFDYNTVLNAFDDELLNAIEIYLKNKKLCFYKCEFINKVEEEIKQYFGNNNYSLDLFLLDDRLIINIYEDKHTIFSRELNIVDITNKIEAEIELLD